MRIDFDRNDGKRIGGITSEANMSDAEASWHFFVVALNLVG